MARENHGDAAGMPAPAARSGRPRAGIAIAAAPLVAGNAAVSELLDQIRTLAPSAAAARLADASDDVVALALQALDPADAVAILWILPQDRRPRISAAALPEWARQWATNHAYDADSIGRAMAPAFAEFRADMTVAEAIEVVRAITTKAFISYGFVVDGDERLTGVLVFRELMLADPRQSVGDIMIREPVHLQAATPLIDAMREILTWHFPAYPVCDESRRLVGAVRGADLFARQAVELSAQAGSMVGVEKQERLATAWRHSFRWRHPWLQVNLLTAFAAAAVVGIFQDTINRVIALAVFLPVLSGQSTNSGSQAMAITVRGLTLGEFDAGSTLQLLVKEAWLGLVNGTLVSITAGAGMFAYAVWQGEPSPAILALVVALAMTASCVLSGIFGVLVPLALRRAGADPASAASIVLSTITDCISLGLFLCLATWMIP